MEIEIYATFPACLFNRKQNPKFECRNPKQFRSKKFEGSRQYSSPCILEFEFVSSFVIRVSIFAVYLASPAL